MAKSKKAIKSKSLPHKKAPAKKKTSQKRAPTSSKKTLANRNTAKTATRVPQTKKSPPAPKSKKLRPAVQKAAVAPKLLPKKVVPAPNPLTPQPAERFSGKIKAFTQQFGRAEISPEEIEARRLRLKNLLVLGNSPGYLTNAELNDTLPDEMQDVVVAAHAGVSPAAIIFRTFWWFSSCWSATAWKALPDWCEAGILASMVALPD